MRWLQLHQQGEKLSCPPVVPGQAEPALWLQQSVTLLKSQLIVHKVDAMHDCYKVCYSTGLCHFLVHDAGTDGVYGHTALQGLRVCLGKQSRIAFNCCNSEFPAWIPAG